MYISLELEAFANYYQITSPVKVVSVQPWSDAGKILSLLLTFNFY